MSQHFKPFQTNSRWIQTDVALGEISFETITDELIDTRPSDSNSLWDNFPLHLSMSLDQAPILGSDGISEPDMHDTVPKRVVTPSNKAIDEDIISSDVDMDMAMTVHLPLAQSPGLMPSSPPLPETTIELGDHVTDQPGLEEDEEEEEQGQEREQEGGEEEEEEGQEEEEEEEEEDYEEWSPEPPPHGFEKVHQYVERKPVVENTWDPQPDNEGLYYPEAICALAAQRKGRGLAMYANVKWEGYAYTTNTWEPIKEVPEDIYPETMDEMKSRAYEAMSAGQGSKRKDGEPHGSSKRTKRAR